VKSPPPTEAVRQPVFRLPFFVGRQVIRKPNVECLWSVDLPAIVVSPIGPEGFEHSRISPEKQGKGPRRVTARSQNRLVVLVDGAPVDLTDDQAAAIFEALDCRNAATR
jgi:hypothetical protein